MTAPIEIELQNTGQLSDATLRNLEPWLRKVVGTLAPDARTLAVRLTGDEELQKLNRNFRGVDRTTDILSFPGTETPEGRHLGDIVISVPTARLQAAERDHHLLRELKILLLHGVIHCLGYDHESDDGEMDKMEADLRPVWIVDNGN
ncbi:MAG: rRNA maturation RNase YbeY [Thermoanaerobaculia bacterium]